MHDHLLRFQQQKYLIIDAETECLNTASTKPWQFTSTNCLGNKIISECNDFLWWSDLDVTPGAAAITRFNYYNYKEKAIDPAKAYKRLAKYLFDPDYLIVGGNIMRFDIMIIGVLQEYLGLPKDYSFVTRCLDLQCIFKGIQLGYKEIPSDPIERTCWMYRLANFHQRGLKSSQKFMAQNLGIPYDADRAHDASYDNFLSHAILNKLIWQIDI